MAPSVSTNFLVNLIGPFGQKVGDDLAKIWPKFDYVGAKFGGRLVREYRLNYYGQGHYWPNSLTLLKENEIVILTDQLISDAEQHF